MTAMQIYTDRLTTTVDQLDEEIGIAFGSAFARMAAASCRGTNPRIAIAMDNRYTSIKASEAIASGAHMANAKVYGCGVLTEDALAYAVGAHLMDGGIYITGGRGGPDHIEMRFKDHDAAPITAAQMEQVLEFAKNFTYQKDDHPKMEGLYVQEDHAKFLARIAEGYGNWPPEEREFKIAVQGDRTRVDHAMLGVLTELGTPNNVTYRYQSDKARQGYNAAERVASLQEYVSKTGADIGFVFDDDGGGFRAVDENGAPVHPAHAGALLTSSTAARWPDAGALADHRMCFASLWAARMSKIAFKGSVPGKGPIKAMMRETNAAFASDPDGATYFRECWWHESGVLGAVLLSHIAYLSQGGLSSVLKGFRDAARVHGPETITGILNPEEVIDSVAKVLASIPDLKVNHERGGDGSFVMRSLLRAHDWRITLTPGRGEVNLCGEAFGPAAMENAQGVLAAVREGVLRANEGAPV